MKNTFYALLLGALLFSCRKENAPTASRQDYIQVVSAALRDSLSASDYARLDFSHASASGVDSLNIHLLRIPLIAKPIATDFFVARTDAGGHVFSGRFVSIATDAGEKKSFSGMVLYHSMNGMQKTVRLIHGHVVKPFAGATSSLMADEPEMDGGDLPPVVVTASYGSGDISYADWYNLLEMAGDNGYGYTGYYSPSSGGGGGNSSAPTMQVDFEAPESKDAIDVAKYVKCFGATQQGLMYEKR